MVGGALQHQGSLASSLTGSSLSELCVTHFSTLSARVQRIFWPYESSQPSMISYCSLVASVQCQWVIQADIDEFLYFPYPQLNGWSLGLVGSQADGTCLLCLPAAVVRTASDLSGSLL